MRGVVVGLVLAFGGGLACGPGLETGAEVGSPAAQLLDAPATVAQADREIGCLQDLWAALPDAVPVPPDLAAAGRACTPRCAVSPFQQADAYRLDSDLTLLEARVDDPAVVGVEVITPALEVVELAAYSDVFDGGEAGRFLTVVDGAPPPWGHYLFVAHDAAGRIRGLDVDVVIGFEVAPPTGLELRPVARDELAVGWDPVASLPRLGFYQVEVYDQQGAMVQGQNLLPAPRTALALGALAPGRYSISVRNFGVNPLLGTLECNVGGADGLAEWTIQPPALSPDD